MALLDGLDHIDWTRWHHAYGPATDVPDLLRALAMPEHVSAQLAREAEEQQQSVCELVQDKLWSNVVHQGSRWPVSAKVVPFLVEILQDGPNHPDLRAFLVVYLHHLAVGYPADSFPTRVDPDAWVSALDDTADDDDKMFAVWARDAYLAVEAELPRIFPLMSAADDVALEAAALLSSFPRQREHSLPILLDVAQQAGSTLGGTAVVAAAILGGVEVQSLAEQLAAHWAATGDDVAALHGACASLLADPTTVSERSLAILSVPLGELSQQASPLCETLGTMVARCLVRVEEAHVGRMAEAIARQHLDAELYEKLALTDSLLSLVFRGRKPPQAAAKLTVVQRHALEAIRDHGAFSVEGLGEFGNYTLLLSQWGLPSRREALRVWLGGN